MSTATMSPIEKLQKLQRLNFLLSKLWDCGVPGCDGEPGHLLPNGMRMPFRHARSSQLAPQGDWLAWLMCTGRGFGKTRAAAEFVKKRMLNEPDHRVGIIAPDFSVAKHVCLEGESGLVGSEIGKGVFPADRIKSYNKTTAELILTNGSMVNVFGTNNQVDAEKVRGSQFHTLWFEEAATQRYGEVAWDVGLFSLRLGNDPRAVITSTPRNNAFMKRLLKTEPNIHITRGRTLDNAANLADAIVEHLKSRYEGTTLGRQEMEGELLEVMPGALWDIGDIDNDRLAGPGGYERIVVAVDPAGSHRKDSDETGIVVVGMVKDHFFVLDDLSGTYTPDEWAAQAIGAYEKYSADRVVAEVNYGGDMVESTLRAKARNVSYRKVTATRGKLLRAEPIKALYEQHRVHHPDPGFPLLEDQMTSWVPPGQFEMDEKTGVAMPLPPSPWSPDRIDALVWAITDLSQRKVRYNHG